MQDPLAPPMPRTDRLWRKVRATTKPSAERVSAKLRQVAVHLGEAQKTDIARARRIVADLIGSTIIEQAEDGIYAQMNVGPGLLIAVGTNSSKNGCGAAT
jgi:hypothetical protein